MVQVSYLNTASFTEEIYREILHRLSTHRRERAERYRTRQAKYLSAGAGYLLSCALKERGLDERDARYTYGEHGKPYIAGGGFGFNLSHSGTVAALATADGEVGVDLEKIRPVKEELILRVCSAREREYLAGVKEERAGEFFRLWTAKESAMKFSGTGISFPPQETEADFAQSVALRGGVRIGRLKEYPLKEYVLTACANEEFAPGLKEIKLPL